MAIALDNRLQLSVALCSRIWGILVLLDVESAEQHDGFLSEDPSITWIPVLETLVRIDRKNTSVSSKSIVATAVVHATNPVLPQSGSTHDARLDCDVEVGLFEFGGWELGEKLGDSEEFSMSSAVERAIGVIHASSDDFAILDEHTSDGSFTSFEGLFGNVDGLAHKPLVVFEVLEDFGMDFVFVIGARGRFGGGRGSRHVVGVRGEEEVKISETLVSG